MSDGEDDPKSDDEVMAERGRNLEEYIREQEENDGMPPPSDDETSRPSPFKDLPGFNIPNNKEVE